MRFIAHFDIDAFYASVAVRDDPSLAGKPVAVAGSHRRSVVLTASYEARPFGVRSAIPLYRARQLCPQLVVVPPDMAKYKEVSRQVFGVFGARGHIVQGLSMDEAFVDLGELELEEAVRLTQQIRDEVLLETRLTVSAGVATGKLIAKIASDSCKPNGLLAITPGEEEAFLAPLPVGRLWGIGPKTASRLQTFGINTIGQVAALDDASLKQLFGSWGLEVRDLARGIDHRAVEADRETKSISSEETFEYDVRDEKQLISALREQTRDIVAKLDRENLSAATVGVKIKRADFRVFGRQTHLTEPTRDAKRIFRAAVYCLKRAELNGAPIRLLGLRVASLTEGEAKQISLFDTTVSS
ncbi:MAG: DNA polymerase IV [Candidatus Eremiobacteraeota bacterium]|nr:DNA polymerase IV [Candidatus Eremiobacteraeota bacterium]